ncbi:hypothetical protein F5Y03DRAFT_290691 [Xylaria venustula]|nr:hypothetical protein F5Y03DRAFT_290691 [Xylaria venustula]
MGGGQHRSNGSGFEPLVQADPDDCDCDRAEQQRLSGRERFRGTVQQIIQRSLVSHNPALSAAHSSPASSNSTLTDDSYLSLPIQQFDEVDLVDSHDRYAEVVGYYGPRVADNEGTLAHSLSIKAGKGLEVRVESYPLAISPGGLYLDDRQQDFSYQGFQGNFSEPLAVSSSFYNYKPVPLRWRFIVILLGGLIALLTLSQVALRILPDASNMNEHIPVFQNITEIRKRSGPYNGVVRNNHGNHSETDSVTLSQSTIIDGQSTSSIQSSSSVQASSSAQSSSSAQFPTSTQSPSPTPSSFSTPFFSSTVISSAIPSLSTPILPSLPTSTSSSTESFSSKSSSSVPPPSLTSSSTLTQSMPSTRSSLPATSSSTQSLSFASTSPTLPSSSTDSPSPSPPFTQPSSSVQSSPPTPSSSSAESSSPTSLTSYSESLPSIPSSTTQTIATTTETQYNSSPATFSQTTQVTTETQLSLSPTTHEQTTDVTITNSQPDEHQSTISTTEQTTATSTLNDPGPTDPGPNDQSSSAQSKPGAMPTTYDQSPPSSMFSLITSTTTQGTSNPLPEATMTVPLSNTPDVPLPQLTTPNPPQGSTQPGAGKTPGIIPTQSAAVSLSDPTDPQNDQSVDNSIDQSTGEAQDHATGPQNELNNGDIKSSSSVAYQIPWATVSTQRIQSAVDATRTASNIEINTSKNSPSHVDRPSSSMHLPNHLEQSAAEYDEPFTTITMTQNTQTPSSPITTTLTTSTDIGNGSFVQTIITTTITNHIKLADPLTEFTITTTYANGTVSTISEKVYDMIWTSVEYNAAGTPTATDYVHILRSPQETTLRDSLGYPTATLYYYDVESTATLYDSNHIPTATVMTTIPETTIFSTLYDSDGRATKTTILLEPITTDTKVIAVTPTPASSPSSNNPPTLKLRRLPDGIYFAGLMLPTLLAIFAFIPIRILNRNVALYQAFHALTSDRGASAAESLCLKTTGPLSLLYGLWSLRTRDCLLGLTSFLVILSALTIPFTTEAFRLVLQGAKCRLDGTGQSECSVVLGVFPVPAQVLSVLLILMAVVVIVVALLLRRWKTGVKRNPWSIFDMNSIVASTDIQKTLERLRRHHKTEHKGITKELVKTLRAKIFGLREWEDEKGVLKRGVLIITRQLDDPEETPVEKAGRSVTFADPDSNHRQQRPHCSRAESVPFFILSWTGRILFLLFLSGVLIAVLTYNIVARGSEYQRGLMGEAVGVRFLFSGTGVLVTFSWGAFFNAVAFLSPYKLLKRRRLNRGQAIYINPATNHFSGLWLAFTPLRRDLYLGVVAITAVFSEVLPLILGNIPCNGVQVESAETICVYVSVALLSVMILTVGWSFFIDWPSTMGADPSTIAGAMYAAHVLSVEQPSKRFFKKEALGIV